MLCLSGTSNWSGDYFTFTAGVGLIINQTDSLQGERGAKGLMGERGGQGGRGETVQEQLTAIFLRDWNSTYSQPVV